mgnify:CR=1 FL=1
MKRGMKKGVIALGLASLLSVSSACKIGELLYEAGPYESVPIIPVPDIYRQWWQEMENCSGRTRNFNDITWLKFPESASYAACGDRERGCLGFYDGYRNRIHIRDDLILSRWVVGHEIVHALIRHSDKNHRNPAFERCGVKP